MVIVAPSPWMKTLALVYIKGTLLLDVLWLFLFAGFIFSEFFLLFLLQISSLLERPRSLKKKEEVSLEVLYRLAPPKTLIYVSLLMDLL